MNRILPIAVLIGCAAISLAPAQTNRPSAQDLLDAVVARLPADPLRMTGDLIVRKRHGIVVRQLGFELSVNWGKQPAVATYTVRDAFGSDLEQLTITREPGKEPRFQYSAGSPLQPRSLPDLYAPIQGSDISWMDLALSFLWWKGGAVARGDEVLGRPCHVVEVPAPTSGAQAGALYGRARLWVDKELNMLLQAEGVGTDGRVIRRLWVKSFKKIDDRWMIKDLEVQQFPSLHRTKLTISDVKEVPGA